MQISLYSIVVGLIITVILLMIAATRRNINQAGAREVLTALVLVLFALIFLELSLVITGNIRFMLHEMKFTTLAFLSPCSLMVYLAFTRNSAALSLTKKILLCLIPLMIVILALTNSHHHFFRTEIGVIVHNNVSYVDVVSSWGYWVYSVYSYILIFTGIGILAVNYYKRPRAYRNQIGLMIATSIAAVAASFASMMKLYPDYGDIGLLSCAVVCMAQYITLVKYSRKVVVTKVRNLVVRDIDSLVLIFDHLDHLVDTNIDIEKFRGVLESGTGLGYDDRELYLPESGEYFSVSCKQMCDEKGTLTGRVVLLNDITELKKAVNELEYITTHDYLTGLKNRYAFHRELRRLESADLPAALICLNATGMDMIYSLYGYEYGDKAITRLANEIKRSAGHNRRSCCARLNGDEIGVILTQVSAEDAENFIKSIQANLAEDKDIIIDTRFSTLLEPGQDAEQLFMEASESLRKEHESQLQDLPQLFFDPLQKALECLRDKTGQRHRRITDLCARAAEHLALSEQDTDKLMRLSTMADIGLLSVSPSIVQNIGNLTNEQWEEMKLHTLKGHNVALSLPYISDIADEILSHHERYDGYGYPMGIKGEEIPLLSRIYSVIEFCVDAPGGQASKPLRARAGTQFDPKIADAILDCL